MTGVINTKLAKDKFKWEKTEAELKKKDEKGKGKADSEGDHDSDESDHEPGGGDKTQEAGLAGASSSDPKPSNDSASTPQKASTVTAPRMHSVKRPNTGPSQKQKDAAKAFATIDKMRQESKKKATKASQLPGPNMIQYEARLAREKKAEAEMERRLGEKRRVEENRGQSSSKEKGTAEAASDGPSTRDKGKVVDRSSPMDVPEALDYRVDEDVRQLESDVVSIGSASFEEDIYDDDHPRITSIKLGHMAPISKAAEEVHVESSPEDKPAPEIYSAANRPESNSTLDATKDSLPDQPTPQSETSVNNTCDNLSSNRPSSQVLVPANQTLEKPGPVQKEPSSHPASNNSNISTSLLTQNKST